MFGFVADENDSNKGKTNERRAFMYKNYINRSNLHNYVPLNLYIHNRIIISSSNQLYILIYRCDCNIIANKTVLLKCLLTTSEILHQLPTIYVDLAILTDTTNHIACIC